MEHAVIDMLPLAAIGSPEHDGRVEAESPTRAMLQLMVGSCLAARLAEDATAALGHLIAADDQGVGPGRGHLAGLGGRETRRKEGSCLPDLRGFVDFRRYHPEVRKQAPEQCMPVARARGKHDLGHGGSAANGVGCRHGAATVADFDRVCQRPYTAASMRLGQIASVRLAELAATESRLSGGISAGSLPRLAKLLAEGTAGDVLEVELRFHAGPESHVVMDLRVAGELQLVCQRCLGAVPWSPGLEVRLTIVPDEEAADRLAEPYDSVLLDARGALAAAVVVEDEILAAMPLAPVHEDEKDCLSTAPDDRQGEPEAPEEMVRPFAGLRALQGRAGKKDPK